jgi:acyl carrier protein
MLLLSVGRCGVGLAGRWPSLDRGEKESAMSALRDSVVALISESAGAAPEELLPEVTFEELGFDSLALVKLRLRFKEQLGVWLEEMDLNTTTTLAELDRLLPAEGTPG